MLTSGSEDGRIIVWNVADGFLAATITKAHTPKAAPNTYGVIPGGVLSLQFIADRRLASADRDSMLKLWSDSGGAQSSSPAWSALLTKAAASFDGKLMVAGDYLEHLVVWEGRQFAEMRAAILKIGVAQPQRVRAAAVAGALVMHSLFVAFSRKFSTQRSNIPSIFDGAHLAVIAKLDLAEVVVGFSGSSAGRFRRADQPVRGITNPVTFTVTFRLVSGGLSRI